MPDVSSSAGSASTPRPYLPATAGLDGSTSRPGTDASVERESPAARRVGWGFISLYALAFMSTSLLFLAPLLVTLA